MPIHLNNASPDFKCQFEKFLATRQEAFKNVDAAVLDIIDNVRKNGDTALIKFARRFDRLDARNVGLEVSEEELDEALKSIDSKTLAALELAKDRIYSYHLRQKPKNECYVDSMGVELGWRWTAIDAIGMYVPGGMASYPSSVLMNAIPAKVAGVERLVMAAPAPDGKINPLVLVAAQLAGVDEIYRTGGAQAIAALAYGTKTIAPVDKIIGPGNAWVTSAKRQVFGIVGIDMIAGPSEVLVVADANNNPEWIATDLLAQAEHDTLAQSILISDDSEFSNAVEVAVESQLNNLPRRKIAESSWRNFGAIILVDQIKNGIGLVNAIAPEHLEIATDNPNEFFEKVKNAGSAFLGRYTPEAIGDYVGGPNHVLPTARSARFSSGLSVPDYMKRSSFLRCGPDQLAKLGPSAIILAEVEGLQAHGQSISRRINPRD